MKRFFNIAGLAMLTIALLTSAALAGQGMKSASGWFDFEDCVFCKNLAEDPGLLEHTTWETHAIKNGMMTIMTVPPEYADSMAKAEAAMNDVGMKIQSGELNPMALKMCGHCQKWGMIMMGGKASVEEVRGDAAMVSLWTSDDAATVEQMHEIVKRNQKELALMMGGHSEHEHPSEHPHEHPKSH